MEEYATNFSKNSRNVSSTRKAQTSTVCALLKWATSLVDSGSPLFIATRTMRMSAFVQAANVQSSATKGLMASPWLRLLTIRTFWKTLGRKPPSGRSHMFSNNFGDCTVLCQTLHKGCKRSHSDAAGSRAPAHELPRCAARHTLYFPARFQSSTSHSECFSEH